MNRKHDRYARKSSQLQTLPGGSYPSLPSSRYARKSAQLQTLPGGSYPSFPSSGYEQKSAQLQTLPGGSYPSLPSSEYSTKHITPFPKPAKNKFISQPSAPYPYGVSSGFNQNHLIGLPNHSSLPGFPQTARLTALPPALPQPSRLTALPSALPIASRLTARHALPQAARLTSTPSHAGAPLKLQNNPGPRATEYGTGFESHIYHKSQNDLPPGPVLFTHEQPLALRDTHDVQAVQVIPVINRGHSRLRKNNDDYNLDSFKDDINKLKKTEKRSSHNQKSRKQKKPIKSSKYSEYDGDSEVDASSSAENNEGGDYVCDHNLYNDILKL